MPQMVQVRESINKNAPSFNLVAASSSLILPLSDFYMLYHGCTVAWRNTLEDWAAEDWTEDVSVGQTVYQRYYLLL